MKSKLVVLAAGGTGGHLFPAQALAETLVKRGYRIHLMTDERVRDYGKTFPAEVVHVGGGGKQSTCAVMQQTLVPVPKTY